MPSFQPLKVGELVRIKVTRDPELKGKIGKVAIISQTHQESKNYGLEIQGKLLLNAAYNVMFFKAWQLERVET